MISFYDHNPQIFDLDINQIFYVIWFNLQVQIIQI